MCALFRAVVCFVADVVGKAHFMESYYMFFWPRDIVRAILVVICVCDCWKLLASWDMMVTEIFGAVLVWPYFAAFLRDRIRSFCCRIAGILLGLILA